MIDFNKTNLLRKKIADEKTSTNEVPVSRIAFLFVFIAKFLIFYGALYLTLTKFDKIPFNFLESLVVYFGLLAILWKRK
jgi:hypothetical protein